MAARSDESRHDRRVTNQEFVRQPLARSDESAAARDFPLGGRAGARANHRARSLARTPGSRTSSRTSARRKRLETNQTQDVSDLPPRARVALTIRASPHRRSARRAIRPTADPSEPRPTTDARIPPPRSSRYLMYYLNEKGERVYTLKVRERRRPPYRAPPPRRVRANPRRGTSPPHVTRLTRLRLSPLAATENRPRRFPHAVGAPGSLQPRR